MRALRHFRLKIWDTCTFGKYWGNWSWETRPLTSTPNFSVYFLCK